ncbi:hypothetical protein, partial [Nocardia wallacei]|uniref:hypothetical protein n=1 Tax=Nocardia wallacei TaxID=480035 RepID=UPI00245388AE
MGGELLRGGGNDMHLGTGADQVAAVVGDVDPGVVDRRGRVVPVQGRLDADMPLGRVRPQQQPPDARDRRLRGRYRLLVAVPGAVTLTVLLIVVGGKSFLQG